MTTVAQRAGYRPNKLRRMEYRGFTLFPRRDRHGNVIGAELSWPESGYDSLLGTPAFERLFDAHLGPAPLYFTHERNNLGELGAFVERFSDEAWPAVCDKARHLIDETIGAPKQTRRGRALNDRRRPHRRLGVGAHGSRC